MVNRTRKLSKRGGNPRFSRRCCSRVVRGRRPRLYFSNKKRLNFGVSVQGLIPSTSLGWSGSNIGMNQGNSRAFAFLKADCYIDMIVSL